MTADETTVLLGFIQGIDKRVGMDQRSTSAWMNVLPVEMVLADAMRYVREHYQESDRAVLPANLVARHRIEHQPERKPKVIIGHDCFDGYVLVEESRNGYTYLAAAPCPECVRRTS